MNNETIGGIIFSAITGSLLGILITILFFANDYKNGQIDALNGNVKYELITNQDSTRIWERIKK